MNSYHFILLSYTVVIQEPVKVLVREFQRSKSPCDCSIMPSDSSFSRKRSTSYFMHDTLFEAMKRKGSRSRSIITDYKILLFVLFLWGLPYTPCQFVKSSNDDNICFFLFVSSLLNVCRTLVGIFSLCYTGYILPNTSLVVTFSAFVAFSLVVNWCLFFKRRDVLQAVRMVAAVTHQVSPGKFRSKWNVYFFVAFHIVGCIIGATTITLICLGSYERANMTSSSFLWYEIAEESSGMFRTSLAISTALTFLNCGAICCVAAIFVSTVYFHLGDVIANFGTKLLNRFEYQLVSKHSISENLCMFQRIMSLNRAVNRAFSIPMLFVYAALMSIFIMAVCMVRSMKKSDTELGILVLSILVFGLFIFFLITQTGDRVITKDEELKEVVTSCTRLVIDSDLQEKKNAWFLLMSTEIRSSALQVSGGSMFVICNHLILTVTSALITYGVILFQMD